MRRRPIPILLALALAVGLGPTAAQALPASAVVHEAATEDELVAAAAAVNADDTGTPQAIRLTGDIAFDGSSNDELVFTHDVTLLGGGHSIDLGSWGLVAQDGATLTLGEPDGSDALVIKRTGSEPRIRPLIRLGEGGRRRPRVRRALELARLHPLDPAHARDADRHLRRRRGEGAGR